MRKYIFLAASLFLFSIVARAGDNSDVQVYPRMTYNSTRFNVATNLKASYSGWDTGGTVVMRFKGAKQYGLGVAMGYDVQSLDNAANNTAIGTETIDGSLLSFMGRLYALNLYVGFGFLYSTFDVNYKAAGAAVVATQYSGLGVRVETGMDVQLSKTFVFTPKIHYDIMNVNASDTSSNVKRLNSFGIGAGLGFSF